MVTLEKANIAIESANIGIMFVDKAGKIFYVNKASTDIFGYASHELVTFSVSDIAVPEDKDISARYIQSALTSNPSKNAVFEKNTSTKMATSSPVKSHRPYCMTKTTNRCISSPTSKQKHYQAKECRARPTHKRREIPVNCRKCNRRHLGFELNPEKIHLHQPVGAGASGLHARRSHEPRHPPIINSHPAGKIATIRYFFDADGFIIAP